MIDLLNSALDVGVEHLFVGLLHLIDVLVNILPARKRKSIKPSLLGGRRERAIWPRHAADMIGPDLLTNKIQKDLLQSLGAQPLGIEGRLPLEAAVVPQNIGDLWKGSGIDAKLVDTSEEEHELERCEGRYWECRRVRRSIHAPDSTRWGAQGVVTPLGEKMYRRHDRQPELKAPGIEDSDYVG